MAQRVHASGLGCTMQGWSGAAESRLAELLPDRGASLQLAPRAGGPATAAAQRPARLTAALKGAPPPARPRPPAPPARPPQVRQRFGVFDRDREFTPTLNERNEQMLKEAAEMAAHLKSLRKDITRMSKATEGGRLLFPLLPSCGGGGRAQGRLWTHCSPSGNS